MTTAVARIAGERKPRMPAAHANRAVGPDPTSSGSRTVWLT
jgi:hypothetical protein